MARKKRKKLKKNKKQINRQEARAGKPGAQNNPKAQKPKPGPKTNIRQEQKTPLYAHIKKDLFRSFIFTLLTLALLITLWYKKII